MVHILDDNLTKFTTPATQKQGFFRLLYYISIFCILVSTKYVSRWIVHAWGQC